jgi:2-polyprenyl-3-methyl-5-hydroxy-6-metoxy-1,4-benzoquinol methylase
LRDQSRQWGETVSEIKTDHVKRYELAAKYAKGRVLDAACGCGYGSSILYAMGTEVVAVDASADAIGWAE